MTNTNRDATCHMVDRILKFLKTWSLPVAMIVGALAYVSYRIITPLHPYAADLAGCVSIIQPILIFLMLFLSFCKVDPHQLRLHRYHFLLLTVQVVFFLLSAALVYMLGASPAVPAVESFMLCMICPTATAAVVVTSRLGGNTAGLAVYTMLINLVVAVCVPLVIPLLHPQEGRTFLLSFSLIVGRVFPTLIGPFLAAVLLRRLWPSLHRRICALSGLAFRLWAVSLALAIAMSARSLYHTQSSACILPGIALASLLSCTLQFWIGRRIGKAAGCPICCAQSLGQKNTVLAIWMGYTFLTPVVSIAGGFYSIWHNVYNAWQLAHQGKQK